jgi:hypothetical protein
MTNMSVPWWPWLILIALGAWHGLNPGMGWLFAVSLGLQNRSRRAVFGALVPIAAGHALAIALVFLLFFSVGSLLPLEWLKVGGGVFLLLFGAWRLVRLRHPKWVGMRVNWLDLTAWSCLMASAHGAGLMLMPVLAGAKCTCCGRTPLKLGDETLLFSNPTFAFGGVAVHTLAHLLVAGVLAWIVYDFVGLAILRKSWFNVDFVWSLSLLLAGGVMLFVH